MKQSKHNIYDLLTKVRTIIERFTDTVLDSLKCYCNDLVSDLTRC